MTTQTEFIDSIPEGKPVRIFLPLQGADKRYRTRCIFHKTAAPRFHLLFESGVLPVVELDLKSSCIINLDMGGQSVSLEAMIQSVVSQQVLEMVATQTINHEQMREYFRVDFTAPIQIQSTIPEEFGTPEDHWSLAGSTIDLSGSGLLAIFKENPPTDAFIRARLLLSDAPGDTVTFLARPVRVTEVDRGRYVIAYHYEEINDEDRDKIVGQCLKKQRHMLRFKVQVKDLNF